MRVFRGAGIILPQLLIGLFWAGSHDMLGGWNQTDDAMLTILALFILTPATTLSLLVTEIVKAFKKRGTAVQTSVWTSLAVVLFVEALSIDIYLLTQVRM